MGWFINIRLNTNKMYSCKIFSHRSVFGSYFVCIDSACQEEGSAHIHGLSCEYISVITDQQLFHSDNYPVSWHLPCCLCRSSRCLILSSLSSVSCLCHHILLNLLPQSVVLKSFKRNYLTSKVNQGRNCTFKGLFISYSGREVKSFSFFFFFKEKNTKSLMRHKQAFTRGLYDHN